MQGEGFGERVPMIHFDNAGICLIHDVLGELGQVLCAVKDFREPGERGPNLVVLVDQAVSQELR